MKPLAQWLALLTLLFCGAPATAKPTQARLDSALMEAIENNDLGRAKSLLGRGASPNARDKDGQTALVRASFVGDPDAELLRVHPIAFLKLLLQSGANVNLKGEAGETALMTAAQGSPDAVRLLLDRGARVNAQSESGETALMRAVMWQCEGPCSDHDSVKLLLKRGANPNLATSNGETALMRAAQLPFYGPLTAKEGLMLAKELLAHGADVRARTRNGNTALKWAKASGSPAFIRLIERAQADAMG